MTQPTYEWTDNPVLSAINQLNDSIMYLKNNMLKAEEDKLAQKANTDFDNVTNAAKNACISWGMPDYENGEDKSLNVEYVTP